MTAAIARQQPRTLIADHLFGRLAARIATGNGISSEQAERILTQTLAFLCASAHNVGQPLAPSDLVDVGWHIFLLYTREYAAFCERIAGRFIHHVPNDSSDTPAEPEPDIGRTRTLAAIEELGYFVDVELWPLRGGKCHDCTDKGCSASGKDGNENTETQAGGK